MVSERKIRVILADDHDIYRDGLRGLLEGFDFTEPVAEAANGKQLLTLTDLHLPDLVLTDIQMPEMNGIDATRILTEKHPGIPVIALTSFNEMYSIIDMLTAGAKGYLLKDAHKNEIIEAIKAVNNNQSYYCRATEENIKKLISNNFFDPVNKVKKLKLSVRELQVLRLICEQKGNKEISEHLKISIRTVEGFRKNLITKTNSKNTAGLVLYAVNNRLVQ